LLTMGKKKWIDCHGARGGREKGRALEDQGKRGSKIQRTLRKKVIAKGFYKRQKKKNRLADGRKR